MDKSTLSNYGWVVIAVLVLSVMIALATPFGDYIGNAVKSTTEGLFDVQQNALGAAGLVIADQSFEENAGGSTPEIQTLNLYFNGTIYTTITYKQGMTWGQWVESEYNQPIDLDGIVAKFYNDGEFVQHNAMLFIGVDDVECSVNDPIDATKQYEIF